MRGRWILPFLAGMAAMTAQGRAQEWPMVDIVDPAVRGDVMPAPTAVIDGVTVLGDRVYAEWPGYRPLRLDFYDVPGDDPAPVVVFVHGGSWTIGHKRATGSYADFPAVLAGFAARGIAVASVEYRLSGEAPFPAAVEDIKAAVRHLRSQAAEYGIDPDRIAIWGGSAGAHLAAMTAFACDDTRFGTDPEVSDCVAAFVGWYGPYDIAAMVELVFASREATAPPLTDAETREQDIALTYFGCAGTECSPEALALASPIRHLEPGDPPALLIHGTTDTVVPESQSRAMAAAMRDATIPVEETYISGIGHSWLGPTLAETAPASLLALDLTWQFLADQLGVEPGP